MQVSIAHPEDNERDSKSSEPQETDGCEGASEASKPSKVTYGFLLNCTLRTVAGECLRAHNYEGLSGMLV